MASNEEKAAFSERLKQALIRSMKRVLSPSELATQFNLRHSYEPITPQAAQKWLTGKAKPTSDKMETLAEWLDVPEHWLNYGSPTPKRSKSTPTPQPVSGDNLTPDEIKLIARYRYLTERQQQLVFEVIDAFALEREIKI